jgi:hypothetical protein
MTSRKNKMACFAGAWAAVVIVAACSASARQLDNPAARPEQSAPQPNPKASQRGAVNDNRRANERPARPWSLQDALPSDSSALRQSTPEPANRPAAGLGRVPLQSGAGSFGLETETKLKTDQLPNGRPVQGLETNTSQGRPYLGLSLSVPTHDKSILPVAPPWARPD